MQNASMPVLPFVSMGQPDILFEDGDKPEVPGWDLSAIWTPGHSPGHLCFWEPANRLMLSGDHVLPRITPNIPFHPQAGADPLGDYPELARQVGGVRRPKRSCPPTSTASSAWTPGWPSSSPTTSSGSSKWSRPLPTGSTTAWDIAARMRWSRPWDRIDGFMRRAAVGEAMAHLRALEVRGVVRELPGEPSQWQLVAKPG